MNIQICILEDNPSHYENLQNLLKQYADTNGHNISLDWFKSSEQLKSTNIIGKCDLLFSDIELNSQEVNSTHNGLQTCSNLRKLGFSGEIVFLTAFKEYVFDGYTVQALRYLLKPITYADVSTCMDIFIQKRLSGLLTLKTDAEILQIPFCDIISISKLGHDCAIQTMDNIYTRRIALSKLEHNLPPSFIRCHKSCIINIFHVKSLSKATLKLTNKTYQTIGRAYFSDVKNKLLELSDITST